MGLRLGVRILFSMKVGGFQCFFLQEKETFFWLQNLGRATEIMAFFQVIFQVRVTFVQIGLKVLKAPPIWIRFVLHFSISTLDTRSIAKLPKIWEVCYFGEGMKPENEGSGWKSSLGLL